MVIGRSKHTMNQSDEINQLLVEWSKGNRQVESKLMSAVYPMIHRIAHRQFKLNHANSLQTTEIVNEAFINLRNQKSLTFKNEKNFYFIITKVIRNIVVDHFRSEASQKRGGMDKLLTLDRLEGLIELDETSVYDWLTIDHLLGELEKIDIEASKVVEYKIFGGFTISEIAGIMSVSESTVSRNWKFARLWLLSQMK